MNLFPIFLISSVVGFIQAVGIQVVLCVTTLSVSQKMKVGGDYSFETSQDPPLWGPGMESLATRVLCTVLVCFHKGRNVTYSYGQVMVAVGTELAEHCVLIPLIQKTIWKELMQ